MTKRTSVAKGKKIPASQPIETTINAPKKGGGSTPVLPIVVALILAFGSIGYFVKASMNGKTNTTQEQVRNADDRPEADNTVERIRALTATIAEEVPTVSTIQDVSDLRQGNPTLYRDAEDGDKLVVWSDKIIVYSTNKDRVLVVMPINNKLPGSEAGVEVETVEEEPGVTIEVRNGSATPGVARALSEKLKIEGFETLAPSDAKNKMYASTVIYQVIEKNIPKTLENLIASTSGTVVNVLEGEKESKADLLIIVGAQ